jgi:hypothetical protein
MPLPEILDIGFKTDEPKLRKVELPIEEIPLSDIENNMDIPYREQEGTDDWNLTPRMCIENFEKEIHHAKKTLEADLRYPIELYFHKDQRIILDGVHRYTKAVREGHTTIKVRKIPEDIAQKTKRTGKKYKKRA